MSSTVLSQVVPNRGIYLFIKKTFGPHFIYRKCENTAKV